ncbi:hypothetical protein DH86_00000907 [Scytalidium sp. 3C]|nr:hypothetical protein DH86_00000907 [Scytalidium sp. 3C]
MASVQSAPAVQQPGSAIPANISQQTVQEAFMMKDAGISEKDPEFMKIHQMLQTIQQQRIFNKQRQQALAQQQMLQQQQQQNANNAAHNGTNGTRPNLPNGTTAAQPPNTSASLGPSAISAPAANANGPKATPQRPAQAGSGYFSSEQLGILKQQIFAFKCLSKNSVIPQAVQQQLFTQQKKQPPADRAATPAAKSTEETKATVAGATDKAAEKDEVVQKVHEYTGFKSPYEGLPKKISYSSHGSRQNRPLIPSILPSGVDIERLRNERETIIYNRMAARYNELKSLPANIAHWDTRNDEIIPDDSLKRKALIEMKLLGLYSKQRLLREKVGRQMVQYDNLAMTANRTHYRRMKKQSLREARITEKLEKQQRDARENREKKKHTDYLQTVLNHAREIQNAAVAQKQKMQKLGRMMLAQHQNIEKEEQKRIERTAKQRLQALKSNDEEAYLKLLDQAKDTRITHLLRQTDGFLSQLAASVKEQQRNAAERYGDETSEFLKEDSDDDDDDEENTRKIDYYAVAHRIKEEVTVQPSILVGGTLKEYQLKGLQWMISLYNNNLNGILADEMGLGKTIQTISLITYLIEVKKQPGPFLVIVPLSTLTNWNLEFEKWAPSIARVVYKGPPNARKQQQQQIRYGNFQVLLTTYEYIIKDRPVLSKIKWIHMIIDEGHRMKNSSSKLSATLTQYYTTRYRLILTGTPLQNNLPELWALLNFVLPTIFKSVKSFDEWFNTPFANTGGQDKMELTEEEQILVIRRLHKVLRPFLLRRLKKDVEKDLPDKTEKVIKCKFSALQARLYKQMVTHNKLVVSDGKGGKTGARGLSNMIMQLRKLCNHPFVFDEVENQMNPSNTSNDLLWRTSGKFELLDRILPKYQATGHRVLMFFQMTAIMDIMEDFLRFRGIQYLRLDAGRFDNKSSETDRDAMLRVMLETAEAAESMEQEEMDDEDLNLILARNDDELTTFKTIDLERSKDPIYGSAPGTKHIPRLMAENELPEIYMSDANPISDEPEQLAGRGARERTRVRYDDGLTEEQWLNAVDDDEDSPEAAAARKQARKERREQNRLKRLGQLPASAEASPAASRDSTEEPEPTPKKGRGRKSGGKADKRKAEDVDDEPPAKRKRGATGKAKPVVSEGLNPKQRAVLQASLRNVYDSLMALESNSDDESEEEDNNEPVEKRLIIPPFVALPSKRDYPQYYVMIKEPISMKMIEKKIKKEEYNSINDLRRDVQLLVDNAKTFNEDGSLIYEDACTIEAALTSKIRDEIAEHPELGDLDDSSRNGGSTAPTTSAGTPLPTTGSGGKVKLTFNNPNNFANGGSSAAQSDDED